jgi:hypothetical protein
MIIIKWHTRDSEITDDCAFFVDTTKDGWKVYAYISDDVFDRLNKHRHVASAVYGNIPTDGVNDLLDTVRAALYDRWYRDDTSKISISYDETIGFIRATARNGQK